MRRREVLQLVAGSAALGLTGPALGSLLSRSGRDEPFMAWQEIREGVWVTTGPQGGNVLMLADQGERLIVDSKFPQFAYAILADADAMAPAEQTVYVLTHHHADHSGGNMAFVGRHRTIGHELGAARVRSQVDRYRATAENAVGALARQGAGDDLIKLAKRAQEESAKWAGDEFVCEELVRRGGRVRVGTKGVSIGHFGAGHTDNDLIVQPISDNVIHTGDLVFNGLHPFVDRDAGATVFGWIGALRRLVQIADDETVVVPGHGPVADKRALEDQQLYFERLVQAVAFDIEQGLTRERMTQKTYGFMEGLGFDQLRPTAIGAAYDEISERLSRGEPIGTENDR